MCNDPSKHITQIESWVSQRSVLILEPRLNQGEDRCPRVCSGPGPGAMALPKAAMYTVLTNRNPMQSGVVRGLLAFEFALAVLSRCGEEML